MAWRWWGRRSEPTGPTSGPAPTPAPAAAEPARPPVAWPALPPVQRSLAEPLRPVAPLEAFTSSLSAFQNPSFLAPLGHVVGADEPGGTVNGLASIAPGPPQPYASGADLAVPPPAAAKSVPSQPVQRRVASWVSSPSNPTVAIPSGPTFSAPDRPDPVSRGPEPSEPAAPPAQPIPVVSRTLAEPDSPVDRPEQHPAAAPESSASPPSESEPQSGRAELRLPGPHADVVEPPGEEPRAVAAAPVGRPPEPLPVVSRTVAGIESPGRGPDPAHDAATARSTAPAGAAGAEPITPPAEAPRLSVGDAPEAGPPRAREAGDAPAASNLQTAAATPEPLVVVSRTLGQTPPTVPEPDRAPYGSRSAPAAEAAEAPPVVSRRLADPEPPAPRPAGETAIGSPVEAADPPPPTTPPRLEPAEAPTTPRLKVSRILAGSAPSAPAQHPATAATREPPAPTPEPWPVVHRVAATASEPPVREAPPRGPTPSPLTVSRLAGSAAPTQPEPPPTAQEPTPTPPEPPLTQPEPASALPEPASAQPEPTAAQPEPADVGGGRTAFGDQPASPSAPPVPLGEPAAPLSGFAAAISALQTDAPDPLPSAAPADGGPGNAPEPPRPELVVARREAPVTSDRLPAAPAALDRAAVQRVASGPLLAGHALVSAPNRPEPASSSTPPSVQRLRYEPAPAPTGAPADPDRPGPPGRSSDPVIQRSAETALSGASVSPPGAPSAEPARTVGDPGSTAPPLRPVPPPTRTAQRSPLAELSPPSWPAAPAAPAAPVAPAGSAVPGTASPAPASPGSGGPALTVQRQVTDPAAVPVTPRPAGGTYESPPPMSATGADPHPGTNSADAHPGAASGAAALRDAAARGSGAPAPTLLRVVDGHPPGSALGHAAATHRLELHPGQPDRADPVVLRQAASPAPTETLSVPRAVRREVFTSPTQHAVGFAAMFTEQAGTDSTESPREPEWTAPVQRQADPPAPEPAPEPAPGGAAAPASSTPAPPAPAGGTTNLDEMARRLYDPILARLRAEFWLDRERSGLLTDLRP